MKTRIGLVRINSVKAKASRARHPTRIRKIRKGRLASRVSRAGPMTMEIAIKDARVSKACSQGQIVLILALIVTRKPVDVTVGGLTFIAGGRNHAFPSPVTALLALPITSSRRGTSAKRVTAQAVGEHYLSLA
jgi:hypothetical protein